MNESFKKGPIALALSAVMSLGLVAVDLTPAAAKPPSHAKAWGYRRKHGSSSSYRRGRYSPYRYSSYRRSRYSPYRSTRYRRTRYSPYRYSSGDYYSGTRRSGRRYRRAVSRRFSRRGDWDWDGIPNHRDRDRDNDGVPNRRDRHDFNTDRY